GDRVDGMGAAHLLGSGLTEADCARLALPNEVCHRDHGFLDRYFRVNAMQVVEVDIVDAEAHEACRHRRPRVLRPAADATVHEPELRPEHDVVSLFATDRADEPLVVAMPVLVGGVDQGDAEFERAPDRRRRLFVPGGAIVAGQSPRSVADRADETAAAKLNM